MSLLEVRNLKVYFPIRTGVFRRHTGDVKAVDDVSFTVEAGTTVGLVGESGSGKTTIGRALLKLIPATAGSVVYAGQEVLPWRLETWLRVHAWLSLAAFWVVLLHSGFHLDGGTGTWAFALLAVTLASGIGGWIVYARVPPAAHAKVKPPR